MSTKLIKPNQLTMWNEVVPAVAAGLAQHLIGKEQINKKGVSTGQSIRILPVKAGTNEDGTARPSLAVAFPKLTEDQLAGKHNSQCLEMKKWLLQQVGAAILNDDTIGGVALNVSKSKRLSMSFKTLVPQVAMKSDIEYAAELGCTVEQVRNIRREAKPVVELEVTNTPPAPAPAKRSRKPAAQPAA